MPAVGEMQMIKLIFQFGIHIMPVIALLGLAFVIGFTVGLYY
jgi:hypothetical protein